MWNCIATDKAGRVYDSDHNGARWHFVSGKKSAEQSKASGISAGYAAHSAKVVLLSWPTIDYKWLCVGWRKSVPQELIIKI